MISCIDRSILLTQLGLPGEHVQLVNADHRNICKFENPSDPNYVILHNAFIAVIEDIEKHGKSCTCYGGFK